MSIPTDPPLITNESILSVKQQVPQTVLCNSNPFNIANQIEPNPLEDFMINSLNQKRNNINKQNSYLLQIESKVPIFITGR